MKSTKWMVEAVLKAGYPVLLYQGIYDAKDGPASSEAWMRAIEWDQSMMFWRSERGLWMVKGRLAGYWRQWKNLAHVVIQGAGHEVTSSENVQRKVYSHYPVCFCFCFC
jgi:vitellogenic carboxypeptidase-like protein